MPVNDIDSVMTEWGKWSRGGLGALNVSSRNGFAPDISDELALKVDAAVVACGIVKPVLRHVLELYYQKGRGVVEIQLQLRVGRVTVEKYLVEGKGFVSGHLSAVKAAA